MAEIKERSATPPKEPAQITGAADEQQPVEWVFTFDPSTGETVKVEKIDKASGQRQELSEEEYAMLYSSEPSEFDAESYGEYGNDPNAGVYAGYSYDPYAYEGGYYQGMADYEAALQGTAEYGYGSEEEQAYYQGMADYAAAIGLA
jgi:hypothetical protein